MKNTLRWIVLVLVTLGIGGNITVSPSLALAAEPTPRDFPGPMSQYHGFDQNDFELKGIGCRVVAPKQAAPGLPWIWRARFWGYEPQTEIALLERGFHVAYCDVADLWGNKEAIRRWDDFYQYLTSKHGFSRRPALEGMSRGGWIIYHWAIQHPDQVSCIYGDAPALGIRPYVREITKDDDPALDKLRGWMKAHELSLAEAKSTNFDALARLDSLAMAGVPVIYVCGDADESVPFEEHTAEFARRYKKLGGPIKVIVKKGGKHHPHSLKDPTPIVDFVVRHQMWVDKRLTHGPMIGHATPASLLVWARCADPGEYQLTAHSETGHAVKAKSQSTPERDGCVQWKLDGLRPGTRYDYQIDIDGKNLVHGDDFSFTTEDPASSAAVRLAFGSCAKEDAGSSAVWRQMRAAEPHAIVLLGDTPYIDSTDLNVQRRRYAEFAAVPDFRRLLHRSSLYSTWDDHDFGRNDTDGKLPGKKNSRQVFIEYRSNPSYGDGLQGIYTKFRRGPGSPARLSVLEAASDVSVHGQTPQARPKGCLRRQNGIVRRDGNYHRNTRTNVCV